MAQNFASFRTAPKNSDPSCTWSHNNTPYAKHSPSSSPLPPRRQTMASTYHQKQQQSPHFTKKGANGHQCHHQRQRSSQEKLYEQQPSMIVYEPSNDVSYDFIENHYQHGHQRRQSNLGHRPVSAIGKGNDCTQEIQNRFQQIQSIMGVENQNLREQKQYLLKTIQKMQIKQRQYKTQMASLKTRNKQLQQQNLLLRQKYQEARNFISNGIYRIQDAITRQTNQGSSKNQSNQSSSINNTNQFDELSQKFDALMYEYRKTKVPQLRKQCIQIAKTLRKLRKQQQDSATRAE